MIKAVLFDFDGVLTLDATGSETIRNYICKETGIDKELFKREYKKYNNQLLYGKITHEEIWGNVCSELNKEIDIQVLYDSFINTPINNEMYDLVKDIKDRSYQTAMVTDNKKDRIKSATMHFGLDQFFDEIIVSAEIGSGKEAEEIFVETIQRLKVNANECIFIDNSEKNLVVPKEMGMKVVFYNHEERNVVRLIKELRALGVEI